MRMDNFTFLLIFSLLRSWHADCTNNNNSLLEIGTYLVFKIFSHALNFVLKHLETGFEKYRHVRFKA